MKLFWKPLVLAIAVMAVQFGAATTARADLLAYWPFDEGSGTIAEDRSGNGNIGELSESAGWGEGINGGALDLGDFNNNAFVSIPSAAKGAFDSIVDTQSATIAFWMNRQGAEATNQWTFIFDGGSDSGDPVNGRQLAAHAPWSNGQVYFDTGGCCGGTQRINAPLPDFAISGEEWVHMVFVRDVEETRIYVNGELLLESRAGAITSPVAPITQATIGANADGGGSQNGLIDDFAIWDEAVPADRIEALIEALFGGSGSPPRAGDFNSDGVVNLDDFNILLDTFNRPFAGGRVGAGADMNFSGTVDLSDFLAFRLAFEEAQPRGAASVPEPLAGFLAMLGATATLHFARPRRRMFN